MKKKIYGLILMMCVFFMSMAPCNAANKKVVDEDDLISDAKEAELEQRLEDMSEEYGLDFVIVTAESLGGKSSTAFADDFYDYNGYGVGKKKSGILFLVSMEDRDWAISTTGLGMKAYPNSVTDIMGQEIKSYLSSGDFDRAFEEFANQAEKYAKKYKNQKITWIPISLAIGFVLAIVICLIMASGLKSVVAKVNANEYTRPNSMIINRQFDSFLHKDVRRHKVESSSGSHTGSSGTSHGGSSGKF